MTREREKHSVWDYAGVKKRNKMLVLCIILTL